MQLSTESELSVVETTEALDVFSGESSSSGETIP